MKRPLNPASLRSNGATAGAKKTRSQLESENIQTRSENRGTGETTRAVVGNRRVSL